MADAFELERRQTPPPQETGRWLARLRVVRFALDEARGLYYPRDRAQTAYTLAEREWDDDPVSHMALDHELQLDELHRYVPDDKPGAQRRPDVLADLADLLQPYQEKPGLTGQLRILAIAEGVEHEAAYKSLMRVGVFEEKRNELRVPLGALAAYGYLRADITKAWDRHIYNRAEEVEETAAKFWQRPATTRVSYAAKESRDISLYRYAAVASPEGLQQRGAANGYELWWKQLDTDLARLQ